MSRGLKLRVLPLPHVHTAAVAVMLRGGPRVEGPGEGGRTHALEHLLFRGSGERRTARDVLAAFEATGDEPDAYTTHDALGVVLELDPARLEEAFDLLADLLTRPRYHALALERAIIAEERLGLVTAEGGPADPDDLVRAVAFAGSPAARSVVGTAADVRGFRRADLERLRRRLVARGNVAVAVAGPVTAAAGRRAAARLARALPPGPAAALAPLPPPAGPRTALAPTAGSPQTDVRLSFRGPGPRARGHAARRVLVDVLDGGPAARIPARLVDAGLCYEAWAQLVEWPDATLLELQATLANDRVDLAVGALLRLLDELRRRGPTAEELAAAAARRAFRARRLRDDPLAQAERAARGLLFDLEAAPEAERAAEDAVGRDDVIAAAREVLRPVNLTACLLGAPTRRARAGARRTLAAWCRRAP